MGSPTPRMRIHRDEEGFTLVELLVAVSIALIVVGAGVMIFTTSIGSQLRVQSQASAIQRARTTMERAVRELRQGSGLVAGTTPSASQLSLVTYVDSTCTGGASSTATLCSVTYTCTAGNCTRRVARPDGTSPGPAVNVVTGLSSSNVFSYSPSATAPTYVGMTLSLAAHGGSNAITLSDGAALRNGVAG